MILKSVIDLINTGEAIAIVGSGVSVESGVPSWRALFDQIAKQYQEDRQEIATAVKLADERKLPEAFEALGDSTRTKKLVAEAISSYSIPGRHHRRISDWPFKLVATTNYDCLIEEASQGALTGVSNTGSELQKLGAGVHDIVWHLHGSVCHSDTSRLVITKSDYDEIYPDSNIVTRLRSISMENRCIFFGFGFNDADFIQVLKTVSRTANKGRPSYAFIGYEDTAQEKSDQQRLLSEYNIELIPYRVRDKYHDDLHRLLDGYSPFIIGRKKFGKNIKGAPEYNAVLSSLRVESSLDLREICSSRPSLRSMLLGSRILAYIRSNPGCKENDVARTCVPNDVESSEVLAILNSLRTSGSIRVIGTAFYLSPEHERTCCEARAKVELLRNQFAASIRERVSDENLDQQNLDSASETVVSFLSTLARERGLGVAQNLESGALTAIASTQRVVALLKQLPDYIENCTSRDAALAAVNATVGVLTSPRQAERTFLGLICQTYFGQHLVGASSNVAKIDLDVVLNTLYIVDASVLICLLCEGAEAHEFSSLLVRDLRHNGAQLATTALFCEEVYEHLRWAVRFVAKHGEDSQQILDALRGRGGYKSNQFLRGYFLGEQKDLGFNSYIKRIIGVQSISDLSETTVAGVLQSYGISARGFSEWKGFSDENYNERDEIQKQITKRRLSIGTFKHDRQTLAEAEVAIVVDRLRKGNFLPPLGPVKDAFFVSSTRVVDDISGLSRRICLLPDSLAQWLWSASAMSEEQSSLIFDQVLWDLAQSGTQFVDREVLLRRFGGVVQLASEHLSAAVSDRKDLLVERYGADPSAAFSDADPLDLPRFSNEVDRLALKKLEERATAFADEAKKARAVAKITIEERVDLERLRAEKEERRRKAASKKRSAQSRKGKRKK